MCGWYAYLEAFVENTKLRPRTKPDGQNVPPPPPETPTAKRRDPHNQGSAPTPPRNPTDPSLQRLYRPHPDCTQFVQKCSKTPHPGAIQATTHAHQRCEFRPRNITHLPRSKTPKPGQTTAPNSPDPPKPARTGENA